MSQPATAFRSLGYSRETEYVCPYFSIYLMRIDGVCVCVWKKDYPKFWGENIVLMVACTVSKLVNIWKILTCTNICFMKVFQDRLYFSHQTVTTAIF